MKSSDFITESKHGNAVKTEAVNKEHALYKEYMNLKKMSISDLRSMIQKQRKIVDVTEYTTKDHAASAILRHRHGDKRVDAVFGGHVDERGMAEGLNEFTPDGFNGGDDDEGFSSEIAKMAQEDGFTKGAGLADGATLEQAITLNNWHSRHGGMYKQYFTKGFKAGRMNKINYDNKQYNLNLKLMKDGSIRHGEQGVAEGGAETSWSNDADTITLQDILDLTKNIKQINLPINDNLKSKLIHWDGNPEEIERINQVTVSKQFPILVMVDEQGQIDWILDGNHRLHKAIQSQAETIPAKLIKPSDLNDKAKKIFYIRKQGVAEGRPSQQHPLEDHEYHKKSDAELIYIAKDARAAAEAAKSMNNTTAENKYLDQANDSATVRHFRKTSGMPDWYKKKYGHMNEKVDQIDELKMGTLARYATKAGKSGLSADIEAARKRGMGDSEGAAASQQKSEKRYAGHYQAINKINNRMKSGVNVAEEVKVPTADGITMQDIRLVAGEGKLTKKTVLQAITVIRKQRKDKGVAEGSGETKVGIEAHGVRGVNSNKWKKTFKSREAFEKWLDQNEGDVEVSGTREVNLNDMFKESIKEANLDEVLAADYSGNVVSTKHKPKKVKPSMGGESPHPYQGSLVGEQQHDPKHIKMAIGIASDPRHKGGDYTGAHNKIEKIAKGLASHPQVAAVLKKQNEAVKEGLGDLADRGEYDYERKLDRDKDYEDDYKFIPLNKRKKPGAKDDGLAEQQNSRAYQAGFSDGQMGREDPRSSSKYGPGVDDYRQGYTDGVKRERQAKQDRSAKYQSDIAPYLKMSDQELAAADKQARNRHEEIFMAFKKKQGSAEMKKEYAALNTVIQTIHQAKYQRGLGEGKLGKAASAAAVVAAMMAGEKLTSAENSELGQTLKAAAEAGDTRAAEHLKNLDMYFDTEQTALITKLSNKYLHGVSESSKKKDACYNKVKSRYKVWPSAYASGALVKCRKVGAANWGKKSK